MKNGNRIIAFDAENISLTFWYKEVKSLLIEEIGYTQWLRAYKFSVYCKKAEKIANKDWNTNVDSIVIDSEKPQAADKKILEKLLDHKEDIVYIVSNDKNLVKNVQSICCRTTQIYNQGRGVSGIKKLKLKRSKYV